jgi:hypothetical protein
MQVSSVFRATTVRLPLVRPEEDADAPAQRVPAPRALVPVQPVTNDAWPLAVYRYPVANFLAHLIAVRQRSPQTRRRGRATPDEAAAAYTSARAAPVCLGQALRKTA